MIVPGTLSVRSQPEVYLEIVAPIILGTILNWTLYGGLITQFYIFTYNFPDEGRRLKYLTYGIVFLETVQSGLALADLFHLIGPANADEGYVTNSPFSPWVGPILVGGVAAVIVQSFFAYRILVLSNKKSWWICLTILFFTAISLIQVDSALSQFRYLLPRLAIMGKLYANAMFTSLNNRLAIREGFSRDAAITIPLSRGRTPNDTSDDMYLQLDRRPSVMVFTSSKDHTRRSRECEGGGDSESLVIDTA